MLICLALCPISIQANRMEHNVADKTIKMTAPNGNLTIVITYAEGCKMTQLNIKGKNMLSSTGVFTGFRTKGGVFSSGMTSAPINIKKIEDGILLSNIIYGDHSIQVNESWKFILHDKKITWTINRAYNNPAKFEEIAFPQWNFDNLQLWKGGILDNGGMVWCKYLSSVNDSYGVHTGGVTFWNPESGNALRITATPKEGCHIAAKYSHSEKDEFTCTHFVSDMELEPRYNLNRFVHQKSDIFAPFNVKKGDTSIDIEMQWMDYFAEYSRGNLPGVDADAIRELLNTTGRYGVVDNNIVGANGWITNWKCLHEPFFAQIGMALNDENYLKNMSATLDQERDFAMTPEGRVLSRWHNADDDQMPGTFNYKTGYYEARWGYTMDSQTGYVINTAEQFDLCGDIHWLSAHKNSCEKALDWLIKRDSNHNGIFEMMNNSIAEKTASDWLDIVWASFENAFINAQLYEALHLWAGCETALGDQVKSDNYKRIAASLKENFNKSIYEGGFWHPEKQQYIYWRDQDGSIHGDNLVTPVNFAVIAFGLCDDPERVAMILNQIEERNMAENLFHWPLCFDSFKREEVSGNNWPFPTYENGDIFPTWGYLGVRAYAPYNKEIALKYIRNILEQYKKDGLSSQRYSRTTQLGLGSDILAGICTSVTALYRDIYGIRPKWNRMGIEPNLSETLNGTEFNYHLRGITYQLKLNVNDYTVGAESCTVKSKEGFGIAKTNNQLIFYPHNKEDMNLITNINPGQPVRLTINHWGADVYAWETITPGKCTFTLTGLPAGAQYEILINNEQRKNIKTASDGRIQIKHDNKSNTQYVVKRL